MHKRSIHDFLFVNHDKWMTVQAYFYAALYKTLVRVCPNNKMEWMMGEKNVESKETITDKERHIVALVSLHVNRIVTKMEWERTCLVRALTASKLLGRRHINSTLYLGVGKEDGKMVAHAWLRCGEYYVTGGDGTGYAMVAKFLK